MLDNRTRNIATLALVVALVAILLALSSCGSDRKIDTPVTSNGNVVVCQRGARGDCQNETPVVVDCATSPQDTLCNETPVEQRDLANAASE